MQTQVTDHAETAFWLKAERLRFSMCFFPLSSSGHSVSAPARTKAVYTTYILYGLPIYGTSRARSTLSAYEREVISRTELKENSSGTTMRLYCGCLSRLHCDFRL